MIRRLGLFSIVQYQPDRTRHEGVNVGVVVFDPDELEVVVVMDPLNERLRKHFGTEYLLDLERIEAGKSDLRHRLMALRPITREMIDEWMHQEKTNFVLLEPEPIVLEGTTWNEAAHLYEAVVRFPRRGSGV